MTETIRFHFDPECPWAWQGAKWIREVERVRDVEAQWRLFSLFLVNERHEEFGEDVRDRMLMSLRVLAQVRREEGETLVRAYWAIGERLHERKPRPDMSRDLLGESMEAANLDPGIVDRALADPSTEEDVVKEHQAAVDEVGAFGVPTIILPSGRGIFGPVKAIAPTGEDAGELWDHVRWLVEVDDFFELKRTRDRRPGLAA